MGGMPRLRNGGARSVEARVSCVVLHPVEVCLLVGRRLGRVMEVGAQPAIGVHRVRGHGAWASWCGGEDKCDSNGSVALHRTCANGWALWFQR
jgi:hypothetical protein